MRMLLLSMPAVHHAAPLVLCPVQSVDVSLAGQDQALSVVWMLTMMAGLTLLSAAPNLDVPRTTVWVSPTLAKRTLTVTARATLATVTVPQHR